ncbi:hypothetical protein ICN84_10105 [Akkermansia glycaniphila]|uniref:YceD family protein n=1 Tax=Akkermansia glycaniphila TaxID=1679444 RepID=UPI001C01C8DB|nr:hypothetical protein [Akkermansia glycaniphila]MBT9450419.1 hypothetical protein [Akkermansia glycaniphila]
MQKQLRIPLDTLPEEGMHISGEVDGEIFGIDSEEISSIGPLSYDLDVERFETELFLRGSISAPFRFRCARCLQNFEHTIALDDIAVSIEIGDQAEVDATDELREEIVLELPNYPKCELAGLSCQINLENNDFGLDKHPEHGVESSAHGGSSVWDALDDLGKK